MYTCIQASKFGDDYEARVHEYERAKRQEETRLEEERRRRREELYGTGRRAAAMVDGGEGQVEVEDLGAVSCRSLRMWVMRDGEARYCCWPVTGFTCILCVTIGGGSGGAGARTARAAGAHRRGARYVRSM